MEGISAVPCFGYCGHHDVPELLDGGLVLVEPDCDESFENQKGQALAESESGFRNVQSVLDSSEARSDSEIRRNVSRTLTVLDAGSSGKRNWILVPLEGQGKQGFIPEQSSNNSLNSSSIPNDFKQTVRDKDGIFLGRRLR